MHRPLSRGCRSVLLHRPGLVRGLVWLLPAPGVGSPGVAGRVGVEKGDHSVFVGEVIDAGVPNPPEGRADDAILLLKDLGEKVFYGG